jgi:putative ABC transport system permease protein
LLGISSILAWIISYFWLTQWLQNFAFRISMGIGFFIASAVITTVIAVITFSFLSFRAAHANPVKALKYE